MNRLAEETSPYLLQHADNPVDWLPWSDAALALARERDCPILLSIGYSACHWCHVMEHESFEDATTAQLMNELFVPVKVDREERPDLDALYMQAVVQMTGSGGWPMTVFLTPAGEPFYGGTYFPPEPRHGMPSFTQVLQGVANAWQTQRDQVADQARRLTSDLAAPHAREARDLPSDAALTDALVALRGSYDDRAGGFGGAPKFPPHAALGFLWRMHRRLGSGEALRMARGTLDAMAAGGIHDQIGGGFHRYAVDGVWLVPHFEKMLYDNALLASAYTTAFAATGDDAYAEVAAATLDYLLREMRLDHGGFASAQDADTDGHEGLTHTWTPEQVRAVLPAEAARFVEAMYGIEEAGNFEGATVLSRVRTPAEAAAHAGVDAVPLAPLRARLLAARNLRPQPARDDKALAAWNGMALAAFALAGRTLARADYVDAARACAAFLLGPLSRPDGGLWRTHREGRSHVPAFLDDYAQVAQGLYELHLATRESNYLAESVRLARLAVDIFGDPDGSGFFETARDAEALVARRKEIDDNPTPSGMATLASLLVRLARLAGDDALEDRAAGAVRLAGDAIARVPLAFGHLLGVLDDLTSPARTLAIVGAPDDDRTAALARATLARYDPHLAVAFAAGPDDPHLQGLDAVAGKPPVAGAPAAYICVGRTCLEPLIDPAGLAEALNRA